jgi:CheY-like chemotaxis protein
MTAARKPSVLIVDDDPAIRIPLSIKLRGSAFHVEEATDGVDALARLTSHPFDLIVLDVGMPRMDGYTLCERMRADERLRDIPVLFLTAQDLEVPPDVAARIGQYRLLNKPFSPKELVQVVRELLQEVGR